MPPEAIIDAQAERSLHGSAGNSIEPDVIREELRKILSSRHFRSSRRGKEFLQYVVDQKISGNGDLLKERLIGADLFGRKPDYPTGEDPVVRVQAGDVRRRLESYNSDPDLHSKVVIQIPLGAYAPIFFMRDDIQGVKPEPGSLAMPPVTETEGSAIDHPPYKDASETEERGLSNGSSATAVSDALKSDAVQDNAPLADTRRRNFWPARNIWRLALAAFACIVLAIYLFTSSLHRSPEWTLKVFWQPASVSTKPVLICLPRPIVYRPSEKLFDQYENTHPGAFSTREARRDQILPLAPTDTIKWGDLGPVRNSGPGIGAVVAAVNIAKLLAEQGIRFELRFGEEATYAEMRGSPVVIVGAINTDWTTQLTAGSYFAFDESRDAPDIHEMGNAKRVWKMESSSGSITRDYGLITRQLSGKSGQFLVQVAGISHFGTEAASEFLANKKELTSALRSNAIDLQKKSFQIVVATDVTAGRAGPPHVVAVGSW